MIFKYIFLLMMIYQLHYHLLLLYSIDVIFFIKI